MKYPVPLAWHTNLHRSLGEIPAYLGTHSTPWPEPRDTWADMSLWARHCSSRNVRPGGGERGGRVNSLFTSRAAAHFHASARSYKCDFHIQGLIKTTHRWCRGSSLCCRSGTGSSCPHSTFHRSSEEGCHRNETSTAPLPHTSESSRPTDPTGPRRH